MAVFAFYIVDFPAGGTGTAVLHTAEKLITAGHHVVIYTACHHADSYPQEFTPHYEVVTTPVAYPDADENVEFLCSHINSYGIAAIVVVAMHFLRMKEIKERTSCKVVYALHGRPFYEEYRLAAEKRNAAEQSGRWGLRLSYWLIQHWRNKWLHSSRKKVFPVYRQMLQGCDRYVVLCDDYADMIAKELKLPLNEQQKLRTIPNGIITTEEPQAKKEKIILFVGRLTEDDKRPLRMVEIWSRICKRLPDWRFLIVGDGPERQTLEDAIRQRGIERMEMVGFSNYVVSYYQKASIVCLTSQYEGWPLCLAEGQAYGVVPVAFNCSAGIRDIIDKPGKNGLLISPYDCNKYAKELLRIALDTQQLALMSAMSLIKAKDYDMEKNSSGYQQLLEELI